ncbi:MAG: hypothetical protein ABEI77_01500 [Halorientalis sp.]
MTGSDGDKHPHEPDDPGLAAEPSEEEILEDLGPPVPEVDIPQPPDPSTNDVPDDLARDFWKLVMTFNVALFAMALGPMLAYFRGELVNSVAVFALGVGFLVYGWLNYQSIRKRHRDAEESAAAGDAVDDQNR